MTRAQRNVSRREGDDARAHHRRGRHSQEGCPSTAGEKKADGKERNPTTPSHFHYIAHRGACGKPQVVSYNRRPRPKTFGNGRSNMRNAVGQSDALTEHLAEEPE